MKLQDKNIVLNIGPTRSGKGTLLAAFSALNKLVYQDLDELDDEVEEDKHLQDYLENLYGEEMLLQREIIYPVDNNNNPIKTDLVGH